jgi:glutamate-1-semialdehyde aminotransferase
LTLTFRYNNIESLQKLFSKFSGKIAAVILEPMTNEFPINNFLGEIKRLCEKNGTVLIFDETITGFRFTKGGAQELFQISPHLSTFGKGIANGYPLSAVCGDREIMKEMESIFFSGTFGGELLSLAAANVVLTMHQKDEISPRLYEYGYEISRNLEELIKYFDLDELIQVKGHPTWKFIEWKGGLGFSAAELKTFFMQEMFRRGLLVIGTHNVTLAHARRIRNTILSCYESVLQLIKAETSGGSLRSSLETKPLEPLFKIR